MSLPQRCCCWHFVSILIEHDDSDVGGNDDEYIRGVSYLHDHNIVHLDLKVSKLKTICKKSGLLNSNCHDYHMQY